MKIKHSVTHSAHNTIEPPSIHIAPVVQSLHSEIYPSNQEMVDISTPYIPMTLPKFDDPLFEQTLYYFLIETKQPTQYVLVDPQRVDDMTLTKGLDYF